MKRHCGHTYQDQMILMARLTGERACECASMLIGDAHDARIMDRDVRDTYYRRLQQWELDYVY